MKNTNVLNVSKKRISTIDKIVSLYQKDYKPQKIPIEIKDDIGSESVKIDVLVKNTLSIEEIGYFIDRVVDSCFDLSGKYLPHMFDVVFEITLLQITTDLPLIIDKSANFEEDVFVLDIDKSFELCKAINIKGAMTTQGFFGIKYIDLTSKLYKLSKDKLEYTKLYNITNRKENL